MKKIAWVLLASLLAAAPATAQSQYQATFEFGVGYTRPVVEGPDMVSAILLGEDFFLESGIGLRTHASVIGDDAVFSWMVRGGARPFVIGNTVGHLGGEVSLHTNATRDNDQADTLIGLGLMAGVSHPFADHLNFAVHVFPIAFEFGGEDTITKIGVAEISAHILF
jgi:hypothetical protein